LPPLVLGPIGVLPERQRRGIGGAMMHAALERAAALGFGAVLLIGHPTYYPRFGFAPASRFGLKTTYNVPDEVFMACLLRPEGLEGVSGMLVFPDAFQE
jgi:predicted N-acetyltransferase YhbS